MMGIMMGMRTLKTMEMAKMRSSLCASLAKDSSSSSLLCCITLPILSTMVPGLSVAFESPGDSFWRTWSEIQTIQRAMVPYTLQDRLWRIREEVRRTDFAQQPHGVGHGPLYAISI